jgi:hypothetical protein
MITNVGVIDAALRLAIGLGLIMLGSGPFASPIANLFGWLAFLLGIALAATGVLRHCPLYARLDLTSCAPASNEDGG